MATDNILRSYGDSSVREDVVLNAVEILTAQENWFLTNLGKSTAIQTSHNYLVDTLDSVSLNLYAVEESANFTSRTLQTPTRLTNIVEIIAKQFQVSRTQQNIAHYHGEDELARQTKKALIDWGNNAEFDIVRSSLTSGVSGTAPNMNGIINAISKSSNTTAHNSGTALVATILDGLLRANWENSSGDIATDLFCGSYLRYVIDGFTQKSNVVVNAPGIETIVRTVSSYETAIGTLMLHKHRYVQQSGDSTGRILMVRPEKLRIAWLQRPFIDTTLARQGDFDTRAIVGKLTLEVRNQDSNSFASGFFIG